MSQNHQYTPQAGSAFISIIKIVKWTYLPYLTIQFLVFLDTLVKYPASLLQATVVFVELSGWGYILVGGPFVLIGAGINYFMSKTNLNNIPKDTTLFEAITQETVMYGPLKMILPRSENENDKKNKTEEWEGE